MVSVQKVHGNSIRVDSHVIQKFIPKVTYYDGTMIGEVFTLSDRLKSHLNSLADVSFTINFRTQKTSETEPYKSGGLFMIGNAIRKGMMVECDYFEGKAYNRDKTVLKYLYFMQTLRNKKPLYCHGNPREWWDMNMSVTFTFKDNQVRMYVNGEQYKLPDTIDDEDYAIYDRMQTQVGDYIQMPYNTSFVGGSTEDIESSNYKGYFYGMTFFDTALSLNQIKRKLVIDETRLNIKFGE